MREMDTYNTHMTCGKERGLVSIKSHLEEFNISAGSSVHLGLAPNQYMNRAV